MTPTAQPGAYSLPPPGFSEAAKRTAKDAARNNKTILLIDGPKLVRLMIEFGVGAITKTVYEIKEIDENYFTDA